MRGHTYRRILREWTRFCLIAATSIFALNACAYDAAQSGETNDTAQTENQSVFDDRDLDNLLVIEKSRANETTAEAETPLTPVTAAGIGTSADRREKDPIRFVLALLQTLKYPALFQKKHIQSDLLARVVSAGSAGQSAWARALQDGLTVNKLSETQTEVLKILRTQLENPHAAEEVRKRCKTPYVSRVPHALKEVLYEDLLEAAVGVLNDALTLTDRPGEAYRVFWGKADSGATKAFRLWPFNARVSLADEQFSEVHTANNFQQQDKGIEKAWRYFKELEVQYGLDELRQIAGKVRSFRANHPNATGSEVKSKFGIHRATTSYEKEDWFWLFIEGLRVAYDQSELVDEFDFHPVGFAPSLKAVKIWLDLKGSGTPQTQYRRELPLNTYQRLLTAAHVYWHAGGSDIPYAKSSIQAIRHHFESMGEAVPSDAEIRELFAKKVLNEAGEWGGYIEWRRDGVNTIVFTWVRQTPWENLPSPLPSTPSGDE